MMELINDNNGHRMIDGLKYLLVKGKNKGKRVKISEIIEPCDANEDGLIITDREGVSMQSWQQYYPDVLGAHFEADDAAEIEALPVTVVPDPLTETGIIASVRKSEALKSYAQPTEQVTLSIPPDSFDKNEVRA